MHEVAESASRTFSHFVLAATGFAKIGNWRELAVDGQSVIPSVVQIRDRLCRVLLFAEFNVNVADQVIAQVVADVHLLHFAVLVLHFQEDIFEKVIVVLLLLHIRDGRGGFGGSSRVL